MPTSKFKKLYNRATKSSKAVFDKGELQEILDFCRNHKASIDPKFIQQIKRNRGSAWDMICTSRYHYGPQDNKQGDNSHVYEKDSPLVIAAKNGDVRVFKLLTKTCEIPQMGFAPYTGAVMGVLFLPGEGGSREDRGFRQSLEMVLSKSLIEAIRIGNTKIIKFIANNLKFSASNSIRYVAIGGYKRNFKESYVDYETPLIFALKNNPSMAKVLVYECGVGIGGDDDKHNPLIVAAHDGDIGMMNTLIEDCGFDASQALAMSITYGQTAMVESLTSGGIDIFSAAKEVKGVDSKSGDRQIRSQIGKDSDEDIVLAEKALIELGLDHINTNDLSYPSALQSAMDMLSSKPDILERKYELKSGSKEKSQKLKELKKYIYGNNFTYEGLQERLRKDYVTESVIDFLPEPSDKSDRKSRNKIVEKLGEYYGINKPKEKKASYEPIQESYVSRLLDSKEVKGTHVNFKSFNNESRFDSKEKRKEKVISAIGEVAYYQKTHQTINKSVSTISDLVDEKYKKGLGSKVKLILQKSCEGDILSADKWRQIYQHKKDIENFHDALNDVAKSIFLSRKFKKAIDKDVKKRDFDIKKARYESISEALDLFDGLSFSQIANFSQKWHDYARRGVLNSIKDFGCDRWEPLFEGYYSGEDDKGGGSNLKIICLSSKNQLQKEGRAPGSLCWHICSKMY